MNASVKSMIGSVIERSALPPIGLTREEMASESHFQLELKKFFSRGWIYVAHTSEFPKAGDFVKFDLGNYSIVVVKDTQGNFHANHNVCRHRGAPILEDAAGNCGRALSCSYHGWTYGHDGSLKVAPKMNPDFDPENWGLKKAWIDVWHGMIFVSFAQERPDDVAVELTGTALDVYELSNAKVATSRDSIVKANWKILWENGLECYHCALNHPELGAVVDFKRAGPLITHVEMNEFDFRPEFPILSSSSTITADGQMASTRLMGDIDNPPGSVAFLSWHSAQFELIASPDHVHIMTYVPISVDETLVKTVLLINSEADEVTDVNIDKLFELHSVTRGQDNDLCEKVQRGIANETFEPGPYNYDYEFANQNFVRLYRAIMDEA